MTEAHRTTDDDRHPAGVDPEHTDRGREYGRTATGETPTDENDANRADRGREYGRTDVDDSGTDPDITADDAGR